MGLGIKGEKATPIRQWLAAKSHNRQRGNQSRREAGEHKHFF